MRHQVASVKKGMVRLLTFKIIAYICLLRQNVYFFLTFLNNFYFSIWWHKIIYLCFDVLQICINFCKSTYKILATFYLRGLYVGITGKVIPNLDKTRKGIKSMSMTVSFRSQAIPQRNYGMQSKGKQNVTFGIKKPTPEEAGEGFKKVGKAISPEKLRALNDQRQAFKLRVQEAQQQGQGPVQRLINWLFGK